MSVFAVSRIRLGSDHRVSDVMWGVVDAKSNHWVSPEVVAPVAEVVAAIRNGDQVVALFPDAAGHVPGPNFVVSADAGRLYIALDDALASDRSLADMDKLGG